jgi:hypothetical protein
LLDFDDYGQLYSVITDFGVTQVVEKNSMLVKGFRVSNVAGLSPCYAAPELLDVRATKSTHPPVIQAADTFSFGVILAETVSRIPPWKWATSVDEVAKCVINGLRGYDTPLKLGTRNYHKNIAAIVIRCWQQSARVRPDMKTVYNELCKIMDSVGKK